MNQKDLDKCHTDRYLRRCRQFYETYPQIVETAAPQLTNVSWYKKNIMTDNDNPPLGILLCTQKDHLLVEYALAGMDNNLFVSKYQVELPRKEHMQKFIDEQMKEEVRLNELIRKNLAKLEVKE